MMNEQDMENLDSNKNSDDDHISTETLHDIRDLRQTHWNVYKREARCKIRDCIKQSQSEWKGALKATRNMGNVLHKVFSTIVSEILQELTNFGEYGSEVSHFIPEPRNTFVKHNIVRRYYISSTGYVYKISFLMLWNTHKDTAKPFLRLVTHV